jgi:WD40-like Beta Propeller Repeat
MSRLARMFSLFVVAAAVAAVLFVGGQPHSAVAKPPGGGGGGTVPPGTIFYSYYGVTFQNEAMKADGSHKTLTVIPGDLSNLVYGSDPTIDRWSLYVDSVGVDPDSGWTVYEMFAVRPYVQTDGSFGYHRVQLTNLWPTYRVVPTENNVCRWSNDGQDSFVSVIANQLDVDASGQPTAVKDLLLRLNVSGWMIDTANEFGFNLNIGPADPKLVVAVTATTVSPLNFRLHDFSRDGTKVAYMESHPGDPGGFPLLQVADLTAGTTKVMPVNPSVFHWSSAEDRLLFSWINDIKTMAADGTGIRTLLTHSSTTTYNSPTWSPDGQSIVYARILLKGSTPEYTIERIPAAGGTAVVLTADLDKTVHKYPVKWVSDNSGIPSP